MRRRTFIAALGGAAAWPLVARGQQPAMPVIAFLNSGSLDAYPQMLAAFRLGLEEAGYTENRNVTIEYRWAEGDMTRLPALADELVHLKPDVIFASTTSAAMAVTKVTSRIPIVCPALVDPIRIGLATSYARPGGHVTGVLISLDTLSGKQLELALEVFPNARIVGLLVNVNNQGTVVYRHDFQRAAEQLNVNPVTVEAGEPQDIEGAFASLVRARVDFVVVLQDAMFMSDRKRIAALASNAHLPTLFGFRDHVDAGGLISYGFNVRENYKRTAFFIGKILKGTKAGEIPIELPTKFELAINLKTAKLLGVMIPPTILARADEVIE